MAREYVDSFIRYSDRSAEGGFIRGNNDYSFGMEDHPTRIHNARLAPVEFGSHGFTLVRHTTDVDFSDAEQVRSRYHPEVCRIVQQLTGAREVFAFMGILRGGDEDLGGGPALSAHVDFNEVALRGWAAKFAPERAAEMQHRRLVNVNVWRGVNPVRTMPLAVCDARTIERSDCMTVRFGEGTTASMGGEPGGLNMAYNPRHRWYYYPDMQPDEVLVFRLFDTADPLWHVTAHSAFVDPTADPAAPKRKSFEIRTLAVFD
jgi:hypothetical protein